jgi:hypothetical protein
MFAIPADDNHAAACNTARWYSSTILLKAVNVCVYGTDIAYVHWIDNTQCIIMRSQQGKTGLREACMNFRTINLEGIVPDG